MSKLKRSGGLIPRYKLPIVHRQASQKQGSDNPWEGAGDIEYTFTKAIAEVSTVQQPSPEMLTPEEQGLEQDEVLMLRTDTPVYGESDGTDFLGTSVYIPASWWGDDKGFAPIGKGGWFTIVRPYRHGSGVINHYQAMLVRDSEAIEEQYPDTSAIAPEVDTRSKFLSGNWSTTWLT